MVNRFKNLLLSGSARSVNAKKNILASFLNKGVAIVISLLLVPITINYLNSEQYGIWLTLSSIVAWISYFDVGLGHGFRNRFAEAQANGDVELARKYITTTYVILALIFSVVLISAEIANQNINWSSVLKVSTPNTLLTNVVKILIIGVCVTFVLNVATIMLSADQKPALSAMITTLGQGFALLIIYFLTRYTESNMVYIALALSWGPCVILLIISVILFAGKYKDYAPNIKYLDFKLFKNIVGLGGKFFIIQISMLLIFQMVNVILSRVLGPNAVTEYNISYKYFSITQMVFNIILAPFWSAYTDAYTKEDFSWMREIYLKLSKFWCVLLIVNILMLCMSPFAYKIWLGDSVSISWKISVSMCLYLSVLSYSNMYMILLNGIGKVLVQMIIYSICALFSIPLSYCLCVNWGIPGILVVLSSVYLIQAIFARYQLSQILSKTASGIWNR